MPSRRPLYKSANIRLILASEAGFPAEHFKGGKGLTGELTSELDVSILIGLMLRELGSESGPQMNGMERSRGAGPCARLH